MSNPLIHFSAVVPRDLRAEFHIACKATDRKASVLVRDLMRDYVSTHAAAIATYRAAMPQLGANDES